MNQYTRLKYNPFDVPPGVQIWEHYPKLSRRNFLSKIPKDLFKKKEEDALPNMRDLTLMISFVILLVDKGSPFYSITDYEERVDACFEALRVPRNGIVARSIRSYHWWYLMVLMEYFMITNDTKFETWFTLKVFAHQTKSYLRTPMAMDGSDLDRRNKLAVQLKQFDAQLISAERELFDNVGIDVQEMVVDGATSDLYRPWAELMAQEFPI